MERRRYLRGLAAAGIVSVAGCTENGNDSGNGNTDNGDDGESTATDADEESTDTDADEESTATDADGESTATDADEESTETPPSNPDQRVAVGANGLNFEPEAFEISAGDTVLWEWEGSGHNVAVESQPSDANWPGEDEEFGYSEGHTHSHTFEVAGDYEYICEPHQGNGMEGRFTVSE